MGKPEEIAGLVNLASQQPDPIAFLVHVLEDQRLPEQGRLFYSQIYTGLVLHTIIVIGVSVATYIRFKRGHLWFTRAQQNKTRLNATVLCMIFAGLYSCLAIGYSALALYQQNQRRYINGSATFELSAFGAVSFCVSVICFTYHQNLPVGFDAYFIRRFFGQGRAATDRHVFDLPLFGIWLVLSLAGSMVAPVIYDYWLRNVDATLVSMIQYLNRDEVRALGLAALPGLQQLTADLVVQLDNAHSAFKAQILVYMGHCSLFFLILVPVSWQLLRLLDQQIASLHRAAEDFFRLGSRMDANADKPQFDPSKSTIAKYATGAGAQVARPRPQMHYPAPVANAVGPTTSVTCHNCHTEVAVAVRFENVDLAEKEGKGMQAVQPTQPVLKPRFRPPEIPLGADFPLTRAKKLEKVRRELLAYSILAAGGVGAFVIGTAVSYTKVSAWTTGESIVNFYTICLWHFCVPALPAVAAYIYLSVNLPNQYIGSAPSTPDSRASTFPRSDKSFKTRRSLLGGKAPSEEPKSAMEQGLLPPAPTRRTQPTFPRAPSTVSLGMSTNRSTTEGGYEMDRMTESSSVYIPPVPPLVKPYSAVSKWVGETTSAQEHLRETRLKIPHPVATSQSRRSHRSKSRGRSVGPAHPTQSWLEIEED